MKLLDFIDNTAGRTELILLVLGIFSYISPKKQRPCSKINRNETLDLKSGTNLQRNMRSSARSVTEAPKRRRDL